jgi:hypothetical protein
LLVTFEVLLPPCLQFRENLAKGARKLTFTIAPKLMLVGEIAERNLAPRLVKPMLVKRIELPKVSARSAIARGIEVEYCQVLSLNAQSEGALGEYGRNFKY